VRYLSLLLAIVAAAAPARRRVVEPQPRVAAVKRVFVVIIENTDAGVAENLPFIRRLAARGAILRNARCLGHPSQPNYIALVSGGTHGVTGSVPATIDTTHLGDLAERGGLDWKIYAERFPGNCFLGETFGTVAEGQYVRRHVPFLAFVDVQQNFPRCVAHVVSANAFDTDRDAGVLPALSFYIPDNQHNGHDSTPQVADAWLESRFGPLIDDPRFMDGTLFVVIYDESATADLRITEVFLGSMVRAGVSSFESYDHYDVLRTIENLLGLGTLGRADAKARPIDGIWK
jgi:hypothetical protein